MIKNNNNMDDTIFQLPNDEGSGVKLFQGKNIVHIMIFGHRSM